MDTTDKSKQMISTRRFRQRIVICGSMSFYGDMLSIQEALCREGVPSIVPEAETPEVMSLTEEDFAAFKRRVSFQYLRTIRAPATVAIVAVNRDKHGMPDYIGPNTFAEIAVAFAQHKRVFLLQGIPDIYLDELTAWGAIPLDGQLSTILQYYTAAVDADNRQLRLFEDM